MLQALCHSRDDGWSEISDPDRISELIDTSGNVVWVHADVRDLSPDEIATIAAELSLDPLAVEDAQSLRQRPKLEAYPKHLFAVMHQLDIVDAQLEASQIACFIGRRFVLTLHHGSQRMIAEALRRAGTAARASDQGPSFVMHALLDSIVDDYQQIADDLEQDIEEIEEAVLRDPGVRVQHELYSLKQRLARLRRYLVPSERVLQQALDHERFDLITERTAHHFRDIHDHALRMLDQLRNVQDLADAVLDLQRSEQANALNEVTKRLTGWAAIIAVPTLIASIYGMNFSLVPDEGSIEGFLFALGSMVVAGVGLFVFFRRRGWI